MATKTRYAFYQHPNPAMTDGFVHFEDERYPIYAGVVECPTEVAEGAGWAHAREEDVLAHKAIAAKEAGPRRDGPTLEEFEAAGYEAQNYPPMGFAEVPSPRLDEYKAADAKRRQDEETIAGLAEMKADDVIPVVQKSDDADVLRQFRELEAKGKNRKTVLDAIDARLEALTA